MLFGSVGCCLGLGGKVIFSSVFMPCSSEAWIVASECCQVGCCLGMCGNVVFFIRFLAHAFPKAWVIASECRWGGLLSETSSCPGGKSMGAAREISAYVKRKHGVLFATPNLGSRLLDLAIMHRRFVIDGPYGGCREISAYVERKHGGLFAIPNVGSRL